MAEISKPLEDLLLAANKNNRILIPPAAMAGIGQFPNAVAPAEFGGMGLGDPVTDQPLSTTPEKLVGFDRVLPTVGASGMSPEGMIPNVTNDQIIMLDPGLYNIIISINAVVASGQAYIIEIYVNDLPSGVSVGQDLSNQTAFFSAQFSASIALINPGDVISIYGASDNVVAQTFIMQNSLFFMNRIR